MTGVDRIAAERKRQIEKEGWTAEHDASHLRQELAWAAVCYAAPKMVYRFVEYFGQHHYQRPWPWHDQWDKAKKHGRIRQLEIAGALIAAEIDRLLALDK